MAAQSYDRLEGVIWYDGKLVPWNEANLHVFWQPTPDPVRYASLYAAAHGAIKRADPQASVLIGGLAPYADGFVGEMYAARPDLRSKVDGVGYHPYDLYPVRTAGATVSSTCLPRAPSEAPNMSNSPGT